VGAVAPAELQADASNARRGQQLIRIEWDGEARAYLAGACVQFATRDHRRPIPTVAV